jgi:hypothetical protein
LTGLPKREPRSVQRSFTSMQGESAERLEVRHAA